MLMKMTETDLSVSMNNESLLCISQGACRILSVYWEMIPMPTTRALLARVVGRLASDASSPAVRHGAVEGLTLLLGCPESHSVLKAMLPVSNTVSICCSWCFLFPTFCFLFPSVSPSFLEFLRCLSGRGVRTSCSRRQARDHLH